MDQDRTPQQNTDGRTDGTDVVVPLSAYRPAAAVTSPCDRIEAAWDGLRKGRLVPERSDIDPREIADLLPHAFILERIAPGMARFRVAGAHLSELLGMEARGMPLSTLLAAEMRSSFAEGLEGVFSEPSVARVSLAAPAAFGRPALTGEMVLLPLRSDLGDITRALGCLSMTGTIGRAPRRLEVTGTEHRGLTGYGTVPDLTPGLSTSRPSLPEGRATTPRPTDRPKMAQGFGEAPAPAPSAPDRRASGGERGHLRLVTTGD